MFSLYFATLLSFSVNLQTTPTHLYGPKVLRDWHAMTLQHRLKKEVGLRFPTPTIVPLSKAGVEGDD